MESFLLFYMAKKSKNRSNALPPSQLSTYDYARASLIRHGAMGDDVWCYAASSLAAAFTACLFSSPFDVVRTRLMNQRRLLGGGQAPGAKFEFEPPPQGRKLSSDVVRLNSCQEWLLLEQD